MPILIITAVCVGLRKMVRLLASIAAICLVAVMIFLQACEHGTLPDIPVTKNVTFIKDIKPITSNVCIKCHNGKSNDYSNYYNAYFNRYRIMDLVVNQKTMPQGEYMSDQQRALFRDWVNQGARHE